MEPLLERGYSKVDPVLILPYGGADATPNEPPPPSLTTVEQAISVTGKNQQQPMIIL